MIAKFPTPKLTDIAELNPTLGKKLASEELISFVPMASLSAESASVETTQDRPYAEVAKGFTPFLDGDVLVAKITPCFENGKIAQARLPRLHGFGSTEFHIVRARPGISESRYLHHYLRLEEVRTSGQRRMTGSGGQRRVPASFLADLAIPLPSLEEQRRIAAILDQAETLRTQRRTALALLDSLTQSLFLDMFGDPAKNTHGLPTNTLGELGEWHSGGTPPRGKSHYFEGGIPWFSSGELESMYVCESIEHISETALEETTAKLVPAGSLMMGMYDTAALKTSIALKDCSCNQAIAFSKINPALANVVYVYYAIVIGREHFRRLQRGVRQKNLNLSMVREIRIPHPSLSLQQTFATRIQSIEALKATHRRALAALDELFASLQQRAFSGELVSSSVAAHRAAASKPVHNVEDLRKLEASLGLEALIYVAKRTTGNDLYTALKTLYAADKRHLENHGRLIYGETYNALPKGPVPDAAYDTVKFLRGDQMFCALGESAARAALKLEGNQRLVPLRDADLTKLGAEAVQSLEAAIRYFANSNFGQVMTATHDTAYERTPKNQAIPMQYLIDMLSVEARQRHWNL